MILIMKKFPTTKAKARLGVAFVQKVVAEAGSIFREYPQDTDLGIDGQIEFIEKEVATGKLVAVQIKAGSSYLIHHADGDYFQIKVKRQDLIYWNSQPIPVVLIAYDPQTEQSSWLDILGQVRNNPNILGNNYTTLILPATTRPFNADILKSEIKNLCTNYRFEAEQLSFLELMASHDTEDKLRGFLGLRSHPEYLFTKLTTFLLLKHLFHPNDGLRAAVTDTLSRFLAHPEVGLNPPKEIREYVESEFRKFGLQELIWLLETAWLDEENLMRRGSLGQSVGVIITAIPRYEHRMVELAVDPNQSHKVRWAAIALAAEFGIYSVLLGLAMNFDRTIWGDVYEAAKWAAEEVLRSEIAEIDLADIIEKNGYNDNSLADLLSNSSFFFLCENVSNIEQILISTTNSLVKYNASRALDRVTRWKYHPEKQMKRLI